jgi:polar amino acid transport system substrate-binding protein
MKNQMRRLLVLMCALGLVAAACGNGDDTEAGAGSTDAPGDAVTTTTEDRITGAACAEEVALKEPGMLTIGVEFLGFDPDTLHGALALAVADELGIDAEFTEVGHQGSFAAGPKDFDYSVSPWAITAERDEAVDYSDPFAPVQYVLVGPADSPLADAESVADLTDARVTTTVFFFPDVETYIEDVIAPTTPSRSLPMGVPGVADLGEVDAVVYTSDGALKLAAAGLLEPLAVLPPRPGDEEVYGFSFEEGSDLVPCVNEALSALEADGTLDALREEFLGELDDLPELDG